MSNDRYNTPLPIRPAPDPVDREFEALLTEPFAKVWAQPDHSLVGMQPLRDRLLGRVAASHAAEAVMHTAYRKRLQPEVLAPGVIAQTVYRSQDGQSLRAGEPLQARLIGSRWTSDARHDRPRGKAPKLSS